MGETVVASANPQRIAYCMRVLVHLQDDGLISISKVSNMMAESINQSYGRRERANKKPFQLEEESTRATYRHVANLSHVALLRAFQSLVSILFVDHLAYLLCAESLNDIELRALLRGAEMPQF
jgi:hypothetical protein